MDIIFRKANYHDVNEIVNIINLAIKNMEKENIYQWDDLYPTDVDFNDDIDKGNLYVGELDSKVAVVYALNNEFDDEYKNGKWEYDNFIIIHRLCVDPRMQNKGIAKKTLIHIENYLKGLGYSSIRLDAFSNNPYALRLYDRFGYKTVGYASLRKGIFNLMEKKLK